MNLAARYRDYRRWGHGRFMSAICAPDAVTVLIGAVVIGAILGLTL